MKGRERKRGRERGDSGEGGRERRAEGKMEKVEYMHMYITMTVFLIQ